MKTVVKKIRLKTGEFLVERWWEDGVLHTLSGACRYLPDLWGGCETIWDELPEETVEFENVDWKEIHHQSVLELFITPDWINYIESAYRVGVNPLPELRNFLHREGIVNDVIFRYAPIGEQTGRINVWLYDGKEPDFQQGFLYPSIVVELDN